MPETVGKQEIEITSKVQLTRVESERVEEVKRPRDRIFEK